LLSVDSLKIISAAIMTLYIAKNGQRTGPYTLAEVQGFLANGTFNMADFAWYEGLTDWIPLPQVPGIILAPGQASVPVMGTATASFEAPAPVRRPVLVWIICLLYFVTIPLGLISLAVTPALLSFSAKMQQQADDQIQAELDRTTDPTQRDQLATMLSQLKSSQANSSALMAKAMNHGVLYYCLTVLSMMISLVAAILLFILRRSAFPAFIASFVVSLIMSVYNFAAMSLPQGGGSAQTIGLAIGIVVAAIGWGLAIAILYYVWTLARRNILH
jgi:hypothetical protein